MGGKWCWRWVGGWELVLGVGGWVALAARAWRHGAEGGPAVRHRLLESWCCRRGHDVHGVHARSRSTWCACFRCHARGDLADLPCRLAATHCNRCMHPRMAQPAHAPQACADLQLPVQLRSPLLAELPSWQAAFISSTSRLLLPVDRILYAQDGQDLVHVRPHAAAGAVVAVLLLPRNMAQQVSCSKGGPGAGVAGGSGGVKTR